MVIGAWTSITLTSPLSRFRRERDREVGRKRKIKREKGFERDTKWSWVNKKHLTYISGFSIQAGTLQRRLNDDRSSETASSDGHPSELLRFSLALQQSTSLIYTKLFCEPFKTCRYMYFHVKGQSLFGSHGLWCCKTFVLIIVLYLFSFIFLKVERQRIATVFLFKPKTFAHAATCHISSSVIHSSGNRSKPTENHDRSSSIGPLRS